MGLVSEEFEGGYVSGIYVVFRIKKQFQVILPSQYLLYILKTPYYLNIIGKYDTKYGAVRANLTYEQLCEIKIPLLDKKKMQLFLEKINQLGNLKKNFKNLESNINEDVQKILP